MTNKEMAADLGRYIVQMRQRIRALQSVLTECLPNGLDDRTQVPWTSLVTLAEQDKQSQIQTVAERRDMLQSIEVQIDDSSLIHALYSQFLTQDSIDHSQEELK